VRRARTADVWLRGRLLGDSRGDGLAGPAPGSEGINEDDGLLLDDLLEFGLTVGKMQMLVTEYDNSILTRSPRRCGRKVDRMGRLLRRNVVDSHIGQCGMKLTQR